MKRTETLVWIIYDISIDKIRSRVAKLCKAAGLYRVQKSAFLGAIERKRLQELVNAIDALKDEETDSVYIFPMCEADFKKVHLLGQAFDKRLVTNEVLALFI